MEDTSERGAAVRVPPPTLYLAGIGVGVAVDFFAESLRLDIPLVGRIAGGCAAGAMALVYIIGAMGKFKATGQDPKPWLPSPEMITTGIYGITRNPMYIAMALLQIAIGIALSNWWIVLAVIPVLVSVYVLAVRHEEVYLTEKFGDAYLQYKRSVRRWI